MIGAFVAHEREMLLARLECRPSPLAQALVQALETGWNRAQGHGDWPRWQQAIQRLPTNAAAGLPHIDNDGSVRLGQAAGDRQRIKTALMELHPWRKGPFRLYGVEIDTEWRSDMKWNRLAPHLPELSDALVLDVGCGSGYHLWRMQACGATAIGIDPTPLYAAQYAACKRAAADTPVFLLPIGIEDLPAEVTGFDVVFSMGVLYHRRSPLDHLDQLRRLLRPDGVLVLETLIVEGSAEHCLIPPGRYAKMRNVWFIPSPDIVETWLRRLGFDAIRCIDITPTTVHEQRRTEWMRFESLADFLDPMDAARTIEGHPAPVRGIWLARRAR